MLIKRDVQRWRRESKRLVAHYSSRMKESLGPVGFCDRILGFVVSDGVPCIFVARLRVRNLFRTCIHSGTATFFSYYSNRSLSRSTQNIEQHQRINPAGLFFYALNILR